jgi:predicted  nucleic acid-binding Zn-ribbon protein
MPSANASATPASSSSGSDPIASPASYNLSALSSPNSYLLSDPMRTPPVDSAPLQVTPVTIESATADESAAGAASPAFALPTFDSRVSYLRSVLDTANRSAAAIPQLHDILQQSAARLAEMEQRPAQQRSAAGAGPDSGADDRDAQLAAARDREEKLNRRIAELSDELAHVHDQHELQLSPLRAELAAAPVFDFAFSSGPPSAVSSPRPPAAAAAAAASGSSSSAALSNPNFGSVPLPLSTSSPSHEWLQQTIQLQNSILELSAEIQQLRNSKRDLVKHSSQELKRMRAEVMQLRGLPVPDESAAAAAAPAANSAAASASAAQADKTCVLQ